ncbi:hypothetical protein EKO27_g11536 [Xylaria grammica]|uniref:Reverse transcriptase n=1 Tax=Xylaria grammica TaxID=363999 RepID=A0A439CNC0_9PEZI|nr:hypothetical protein EKO27_g11536 [Xylaria grammica]
MSATTESDPAYPKLPGSMPEEPGSAPGPAKDKGPARDKGKGKEVADTLQDTSEDDRSPTMSAPPQRPTKIGGNKETATWLAHKIDGVEQSLRSMRDENDKRNAGIDAFLEFHRIQHHIPEDADLSTASQWRAMQGTTPSGVSHTTGNLAARFAKNANKSGVTVTNPVRFGRNPTNPTNTASQPSGSSAPTAGAGGGGGDPDGDDSESDPDEFYRDGHRDTGRRPHFNMPRDPNPPGNPNNPNNATERDGTPHSGVSFAGGFKLKREDIGSFDPEYSDPNDIGVVTEGRNLIFTDVFSFTDRIESFLEEPASQQSHEAQIMGLFQTLLTGPAVSWWNNEITPTTRRTFRQRGLHKVMEELQKRFALDSGIATQRFEQATLTLGDIQRNQHELPQFIQRKLRYARAMGILTADNVNWRGVMTQIRNSMSLEVKQFIKPPRRNQTLDEYMLVVEEARGDLDDLAREVVGNRKPSYHATTSRQSRPQASKGYYVKNREDDQTYFASSGRNSPRNSRRYWANDRSPSRERDNRRDDRFARNNRFPRGNRDRYRDNRGWNRNDRQYNQNDREKPRQDGDMAKERREYDRKRDARQDGRVHFVDDSEGHEGDDDQSENDHSQGDEEFDNEVYAHCVVDATMVCPRCNEEFDSIAHRLRHHRACTKDLPLETMSAPSPVDPSRRTCGYCNELFPSRNRLFKHLRACTAKAAGVIRNPAAALSRKMPAKEKLDRGRKRNAGREAYMATADDKDVSIEDATDVCDSRRDVRASGYTYLKFGVRNTPEGEDLQICGDPGSGNTIIGREFLKKFDHTIETKHATLRGIGKGGVHVHEWATFTFWSQGMDSQGNPKLLKFKKGAWVVDDRLEPGCLLGNDFLVPHRVTIRYADFKIIFPDRDNFAVTFDAIRRGRPLTRKVTSRNKVALRPGESAYVVVDYKPLPTDRNFAFFATHQNVMHTVLDAKTPHVVPVKNTTDKVLKLDKGAKLGSIMENQNNGCYGVSWKGAMNALAIAAATEGDMGEAGVLAGKSARDIALNAEFSMTPIANAVATDTVPQEDELTFDEMADIAEAHPREFATDTPVSDAVYNIVQTAGPPPMTEAKTGGVPNMRVVPPPTSTDAQDQTEMAAAPEQAMAGVDETPTTRIENGDPHVPVPEEPPKPKLPEVFTTLGIRKPTNLPERVTDSGVHIYSEQASIADMFAKVVDRADVFGSTKNQKLSSRSYPLSRKDMKVLNEIHDNLHNKDRMEWVSEPTPFAHPLFVVWRTVHGVEKGRVVNDLRNLNRIAVPDNYPLPLQANVINALKGKKFITIVDATGFFHQFSVHPDYRDRFTIISPRGLERSKVALMGFRNTPAYAQRFMDKLLRDYDHYCKAFIDDICIFSNTAEEHAEHLTKMFALFKSKNIAINPKKSFIGYPSVELLGFQVDGLGMATSKDRLEAFRNLAFPRQLKALEQYIGATGFLRRLIPYYARLIEPLQQRKTSLLAIGRREGRVASSGKRQAYVQSTYFEPTEAEMASFQAMQDAICKETSVHHHDPDRRLFLQVDGSKERGFGAMVFHLQPNAEWHPGKVMSSTDVQPVMFLSRSLTHPELRYGPSELEVACLVWAVKKLRTVIGSSRDPVVVLTDHSATKGIVDKTTLDSSATDRCNIRLINASVYLNQYGLQVFHLPGRLNLVPDALSRLKTVTDAVSAETGKLERDNEPDTLDMIWHTTEVVMDEGLVDKFKRAYKSDPKFVTILQELQTNEDVDFFSKPGYPFEVRKGLVYNTYQGERRLCVPHGMIKDVLAIAHDDKHHFGVKRMLQDLDPYQIYRKTYLVKKYVKHCHGCDLNRTDRQRPVGNMHPIRPKDPLPMRTIAIDFILSLPKVKSIGTPWQLSGSKDYFSEYNQLMTVSCHTSKRTLLIPGHEKYTAEEWGMALTKQLLLSDWGIPKGIISDRDRKFTSEVWKGIWKALGTRLLMSTAYHPQTDGLSERKNQTVEIALRYYNFTNPESCWLDVIPSLQWNLNAAYSEAIHSSPHEQLFGFKLPGALEALTDTQLESIDIEQFKDIRFFREHLRRDANLAMDFAAVQAKRYYDGKHRSIEFEVGDKVYLKLHSGYHLPGKPSRKYSQQMSGPFEVKRRVGTLAYELDLPPDYIIHPVISVAHLRPTPDGKDPFDRYIPPPGPVEADQDGKGDLYEVEILLKHRITRGKMSYLVKWKGWGHQYNQWMAEGQLDGSQELIEEYWERNGGRPRGRGRPRKGA